MQKPPKFKKKKKNTEELQELVADLGFHWLGFGEHGYMTQ